MEANVQHLDKYLLYYNIYCITKLIYSFVLVFTIACVTQ